MRWLKDKGEGALIAAGYCLFLVIAVAQGLWHEMRTCRQLHKKPRKGIIVQLEELID